MGCESAFPCACPGVQAPAAALGRAVSELDRRHLPAQSSFSRDSSAPSSAPARQPTAQRVGWGHAYHHRQRQDLQWSGNNRKQSGQHSPPHLPGGGAGAQGHPLTFPGPWRLPFLPLLFPTGQPHPERDSSFLQAHSRVWPGSRLGLGLGQLSHQGNGELCPPLLPRPWPPPSFRFSEPGGRERGSAPLRAVPACSPRAGILHPAAPRRHRRRIKDRWITANEPACTINTREPSRD